MRLVPVFLILLSTHLTVGQVLVHNLKGMWKFTIGSHQVFARSDFDDSLWGEIHVPGNWEDQGFPNYDGYAWYRIKFDGRVLGGHTSLQLRLGKIDDANETYLNGQMIGLNGSFPPEFSTAWKSPNIFNIPEELLNRNGENVIAVKVYDAMLGGGILDGEIGIYTTRSLAPDFLNLEGIWRFYLGELDDWAWGNVDDSRWQQVKVPGFWSQWQHKKKIRVGHYRKQFVLPENLRNQDLVVILGRIDDFDATYLNGKKIGMTNDGKRLGESNSWREHRIYFVPKEDFNQTGLNTLAVKVLDMGGEAGIYEGPIGIIPAKQLHELLSKFR
jgi:hypothetical protein